MKRALAIQTVLALVLALARTIPAEAEMNPRFEALRPLLGKTWKGVFPNSTATKPVVDVSRFEVALNGQAVRNLHSINAGEYGGESLIVWDKAKDSLVFYYFTTAGYYTTGTMQAESGGFVAHENVIGDAEGITEVRSTSQVGTDGRLHVVSQYLKKGQWVEGRNMYYSEDKDAVVRFRD
jgi:hypothetical protein